VIHDVKDVQRVLDERFGGAGRSPWSLLRIVAWAVVGVLAVGWLVPIASPKLSDNKYNAKIKDLGNVRVVTYDKNDPRGFRTTHDGNAFTIAWIGPSTLQSISKTRYAFIPDDVRARIPQIGGRRVAVDIYFLSGARVMDLYSAVQAAINSDADMIVLDLNPLWLFNDRALQSWDNLNGTTFATMVDRPSEWPLAAALYSPSDVVTGLAAKAFPAINDRWSYSQKLRKKISVVNRLDESTPPPASGTPGPLDLVAQMQEPLEFWTKYRWTVPASATLRQRQQAFLEQSVTDGGTASDVIVQHLFSTLAASGKPAYVYVPPLAPDALAEPPISEALTRIEDHLGQVAKPYQSKQLEIGTQSLARVLPPMKFNDLVHTAEDGPMADYLAQAICDQVIRSGAATTCTPTTAKASS
jgi:hypothetical protein